MDLKQLEYIIKIADEKSITRAAEKLFLTQSALNQQLLKLEKDLGVRLFKRTKSDWSPTPAGEIYLEGAREILCIRHRTYSRIRDLADRKKGCLSIGFTPGRGIEMFTNVYPRFHSLYPDMTVTPNELSVRRQQALITAGELDLGFMTLCQGQRTKDNYITLFEEEIVLALPQGHPLSRSAAPQGEPLAVMDLGQLRYEPFVLMYKESTIRRMIDDIFRGSGFVPNVLFETSSNSTILSMIQARLCCGVIPWHYVKNRPEGIACFALPSRPVWEVTASYGKYAYLSNPAREFIRLVKEYWTA
ncbi:MAG: LysR family transcriptional regulator [Hungatella sp.]|nr:LysR family transcriptional regulator [Hungatella sp.]